MATPPVFVANTVLTAAQMNQVGMWRISNDTTPGTATTFTKDDVFTSDFRHYRLYVSGSTATAGNCTLQLRASGTAATTNYAWNQVLRDLSGTTNTVTSSGGTTSSVRLGLLNTGALGAASSFVVDILDPQITTPTMFFSMNVYTSTAAYSLFGTHYAALSYDGFTLTGAGNLNVNVELFGLN